MLLVSGKVLERLHVTSNYCSIIHMVFLTKSWILLYVLSAFVNNHNDCPVTLDLFGCTILNVFKHNFNTLFPRCYLLSFIHP